MIENQYEIDKIATKIRAILNISYDNFNLNEIIKKLGGTITFNSFCDSKSKVMKTSCELLLIEIRSFFL